MPITSGTYNFQSIEVELLIREAYERIGISGEFIEGNKLESAKRSINFLLLEWMNKSVNLWTLKNEYLGLIPGKRQYTLPSTVSDIIQVSLRISNRQLSGTAQTNTTNTYDNAGGGNAANAFDDNSNSGCTQNVNNGNISYDFGNGNSAYVTFVGLKSNVTSTYNLLIEYTLTDPTDLASWQTLLAIPTFTYIKDVPFFYDVPIPVNARAYRVRAIDVSDDLNLSEIYFNSNTVDSVIASIGRYEYNLCPNKYLIGRPNMYYLDRDLTPTLHIYPTAGNQYNCLCYSYKQMMQDAGQYTNAIQIPARMYPPLVWGLAWQLSLKFVPQLVEMMEAKYEQSFMIATREDTETLPLTIQGSDS